MSGGRSVKLILSLTRLVFLRVHLKKGYIVFSLYNFATSMANRVHSLVVESVIVAEIYSVLGNI